MVKRFQRRTLGSMRSLCWTDHANVTKLQAGAEIDTKHLRWTSEIQADGSEIRSLSGRACRLGDGYSRNPPDRDRLIEQRTKDLEGLCGQVRGFDLEAFLGEYESGGLQVSCLADDALPVMAMARDELSAQARQAVRVLYIADYMSENRRVAESGAAWRTLQQMMPDASVHMALCLGPFEDDMVIAAFFEGTRPRMNPAACAKQLRRDLLTGIATGLRAVELHKPHLILGLGQGGIIALAMSRPLVVETAMWARNVQHEDSTRMAAAWKAVKGCVAVQPRPGKARFSPEALLGAVPE